MTIPYFKRTEESYVRRIEPRQPKSFRNIIAERMAEIALAMEKLEFKSIEDARAQDAVEGRHRHQRQGANRFEKGKWHGL